ncbi:MAG: glycosyltransferase family 1 protein [Patescibacteria group bacterium]
MKRVLIDCRLSRTASGIGRYTRELVTELLKTAEMHFMLLVRSRHEEWLKTLPKGSRTIVEADIPHYSIREQLMLPWMLRSERVDLLFSPHFNVPLFCPVPFVATIHDLILHRYPNEASKLKQIAYRMVVGSCIRRARALIAVSNFTAREIEELYGADARRKTTVIHEGVEFESPSKETIATVLRKFNLWKPYFLYVGNAKQHKNVPLLLRAFSKLEDPSKELVLVCGGKETKNLRLPRGVRGIASVSDQDLPALYASALAFVTPSLYEGFCLPVLEAEAVGCPVIAVGTTAIPEVAPPGSRLIEPTVEALTATLKNPPRHHESRKRFLWKDAAQKTVALLHEVAGSARHGEER